MTLVTDADTGKAISQLEADFEFRDSDVRRYLSANPEVIRILEEISDVIPTYFGAEVQLALEMLHDPEDGQHGELYAVIQSPLEPESALGRLRAFDEGWWVDRVPTVDGGLTITLE